MRRLALLLVCAFAASVLAQEPLTNTSIIKLVQSGISDEIIVSMIQNQPTAFSVKPDDIIALKNAGVSQKVIAAIAAKPSNAVKPTAPVIEAPGPGVPVSEVGVYYRKGEAWLELPPEVVNFKTGGVLKSIGTAGIVKGDVNGHINGATSKTTINTPVEILIYTPEGVNVSEYQLLRLRQQAESREFRTVTGGVLHVSGGATRDAMAFDSKKIAPRTYQITLTSVGHGEYGFLPPAGSDATASSGRIGKIYSFKVGE